MYIQHPVEIRHQNTWSPQTHKYIDMPLYLMSSNENENENVKITTVNVKEESSPKSNDSYSISTISYSFLL